MKIEMRTTIKFQSLIFMITASLFSQHVLSDNRPWGGFSRPEPSVNQTPPAGYKGQYNPWLGQGIDGGNRRNWHNIPETGRRQSEAYPAPGGMPGYGYPYGPSAYPYGGAGMPYTGMNYPYYDYSPLYSPGLMGYPYGGGWPGGYNYWGW